MGRGRQKAKHTKVARELKYNVPETDYEQLQRELQGTRDAYQHDDELSKWSEFSDDEESDEGYGEFGHRRLA